MSVTVPCPVCETPAAPDDRFCAGCGALLPDTSSLPASRQLDLEGLFSPEGRIGRLEFLLTAVVLSFFLSIALGLLAAMNGNIVGILLGGALSAAAAFALVCCAIKRLHDVDTSGWLAVIALIPLVGWVFLLVLALIGPTQGQNIYGPPHGGSLRPPAV
jgi:uncharacterized membrane protein YhaH (DUF805 family)